MLSCAERVAPGIGVFAWVVDNTGIVKDGDHSPGVKRGYSGTLGKVGNCQITVSVHAVGERGALPLGWRLYLPEEWCEDLRADARRRSPTGSAFERSRSLRASCSSRPPAGKCRWRRSWPTGPTATNGLPQQAGGVRARVCGRGAREGERVRAGDELRGAERNGSIGRPRSVARPDRRPDSALTLARRLPAKAWKTLPCRTTPTGTDGSSRFAFVRVIATNPVRNRNLPPREEWLIVEWPKDEEVPSDYWLSNLRRRRDA